MWLNASCSNGCPAQFQVATVDANNAESGQDRIVEVGGPVGQDDDEQDNGYQNRETIPPALYVPYLFLCAVTDDDEQLSQSKSVDAQPQDDDGKQFFRRILLYLNHTVMEHAAEHEVPRHSITIPVEKASDMIEKAAEATLALLDEHFTCSL